MRIGLVAGESSGDLLGAGLIRAIRGQFPEASFEGVAGPAMRDAGCEQWETAESLAVMGLIEPLAHIPRLLRLRKSLIRRWMASPPDVFVGIDAPDFNLGLETRLRGAGIRTAHYVSPSIWAWRPGRVHKVKKAVDRVLCILPFEKPIYDKHGVDAVFVGHPKADSAPAEVNTLAARAAIGCAGSEVVAVLPGSRRGEVERLGATLAATAALIKTTRAGVAFVTPVATPELRSLIEAQLIGAGVRDDFTLLEQQSELAMSAADVVLLASGTAALESALLGKPTVASYRVAPLSYAILKGLKLLKLTHFTLPNLLTSEPLIPEFMQGDAEPGAIAIAVTALLDDPERRDFIRAEFAKLRIELAQDTDRRAADAIIGLARN